MQSKMAKRAFNAQLLPRLKGCKVIGSVATLNNLDANLQVFLGRRRGENRVWLSDNFAFFFNQHLYKLAWPELKRSFSFQAQDYNARIWFKQISNNSLEHIKSGKQAVFNVFRPRAKKQPLNIAEESKVAMIRHMTFIARKVKKGDKLNYKIPKKGEYLFIFLTRPTKEEIKKLTSDFRFDPEPLETYVKETHSRRYITKPFQFVIRTAYLQNNTIGYTNLLFIMMSRTLIVSASKPSDVYGEIIEDISESFQTTEARSVGHILYNFLQEDVDENYDVLGRLEQQIKDVEAKATRIALRETKVRVDDILALKRQLFRLSRQFWATTRVISLIRIGVAQVEIDRESERLLGDVHETYLHQIDLAAAQKEMVSDVLNVYSTSISNIAALTSNELNTVVKRLTSYGAILLIPTVIASIYGMNILNLPFAKHQYGFYIIIGIMAGVTGVALANFIKNDWL